MNIPLALFDSPWNPATLSLFFYEADYYKGSSFHWFVKVMEKEKKNVNNTKKSDATGKLREALLPYVRPSLKRQETLFQNSYLTDLLVNIWSVKLIITNSTDHSPCKLFIIEKLDLSLETSESSTAPVNIMK